MQIYLQRHSMNINFEHKSIKNEPTLLILQNKVFWQQSELLLEALSEVAW